MDGDKPVLRVLEGTRDDGTLVLCLQGDIIEFTQGPPAMRRMFELTGTLGLLPFAETA